MSRLSASFAVLALCAMPLPGAAQAQAPDVIAPADSARLVTIEQLLVVTDAEKLYDQSIEASIAAQLKANPEIAPYEDIFRAFMARHASYASMKEDFIRIYRASFSEADMQETIRFYQSPFGRRLMAKMPLLMAQSSELSARRVQAHLPELIAEIQARIAATQAPAPASGQ